MNPTTTDFKTRFKTDKKFNKSVKDLFLRSLLMDTVPFIKTKQSKVTMPKDQHYRNKKGETMHVEYRELNPEFHDFEIGMKGKRNEISEDSRSKT